MWDEDEDGDGDWDDEDEMLSAEEDYVGSTYLDLHERLDDAGGLDERFSEADVWDAVFDEDLQSEMETYIDEQRAEQVSHCRRPSRSAQGSSGCELIIFLIAMLGFASLCMTMMLGSN
jgi:hypothetical protein